jgi:predicted aldo/keto reductase-like oxidoreductase
MKLTTVSGDPISRLGLGAREDRFPEGAAIAVERGVNFLFIYHLGGGRWAAKLRELAAKDRARVAITAGSGARDPEGLRGSLATYLEALGTDHLDVFFAEYVRPDEDPERVHGDGGTLSELARWKDEGRIRYVGATAHDRVVSRRLAEDRRVDVLMQRYNMAHRKAGDEVFPACRDNDVAVIAFTATRWGSLLSGHPEWPDQPPSALDCYRFCDAHPDIDVVLASAPNAAVLQDGLGLLDAPPPMVEREVRRWQRYGDLVYGDGADSFETDWP